MIVFKKNDILLDMDKKDLIITALQQRVGEIVSSYETQVALLRAEITQLIEEKDARNKEQEAGTAYPNLITD